MTPEAIQVHCSEVHSGDAATTEQTETCVALELLRLLESPQLGVNPPGTRCSTQNAPDSREPPAPDESVRHARTRARRSDTVAATGTRRGKRVEQNPCARIRRSGRSAPAPAKFCAQHGFRHPLERTGSTDEKNHHQWRRTLRGRPCPTEELGITGDR